MEILVNGQDRSDSLGGEIQREAEALRDSGLEEALRREQPVLDLGSCRNESEFQHRHAELLRSRNCVDTARFHLPVPHGLIGRLAYLLRLFVWKAFRYQHDWMSFAQNSINVQFTEQLEMERCTKEKRLLELERRVARIEKAGSPSARDG